MKDKLEKTGHKKGYYRLRAFFRVCFFAALVMAAAVTPVVVTYSIELKAEAETSEVKSSEENHEPLVALLA